MPPIYVSSRFGNNANNGLSANAPKKTLAAAIAASTSGDTIYVYEGAYNEKIEPNRSYIGLANSPFSIIVNGSLLTALSAIGQHLTLSNFTIQNQTGAIIAAAGAGFNIKNIISYNNSRTFDYQPSVSQYEFTSNLFYDNFKSSLDILSFTNETVKSKAHNTWHNGQMKLANTQCGNTLKYWILSDFYLEIDANGTSMKYSIFYGNSFIKKTGNAYTALTQDSDLLIQGIGTFTGCKVYPDITAAATNNGAGKIRITKAAHGKVTGDFITIRTSTNYKTPKTIVTYVDANNFDVDIDYIADEATIKYNYILYVNEFKKDFRVFEKSIAFMNYENPYKPIGAMCQAIEYPKTSFSLTNMVKTGDSFYLVDPNSNGSLAATATLVLSVDALKQIYAFNPQFVAEYENGKNIDNTSDKAESYAAGDTCPAGYYVVEVDTIVSTTSYAINEKFYKSTSFTFTTTNGGIVRRIPDAEWLGLNNTLTVRLKKGTNWSGDLLFKIGGSTYDATLGRYVNKMNYVGNDANNAIEYGDGDPLYRSANAFPVIASEVQIMNITVQANAVKQ